jgi:hypothetical protein
MKSFKDILSVGGVFITLALMSSNLYAEKGPQDNAVTKKSFDDLLNDPSAILDMQEEDFTDLLPPLENKTALPGKPMTEGTPRNLSQSSGGGTSILASPFIPMMPSSAGTPPPPGPYDAKTPFANVPIQNGMPVPGYTALPLVLAPSFFVAMPSTTFAPGERLPVPPSTPMVPMPGVPDISIILANNQFYPSRIRLKEGIQTRLIFTTTNKRPAALVVERLQIQRWIAKEDEQKSSSEMERIRWEVSRELNASRVTEIIVDPKEGIYSFHDAMTGASGEITVE